MKKILFRITSVADCSIEAQDEYERLLDQELEVGEEYSKKYNDFMLNSPMANQGKQIAEATEKLREDPVYMKFKEVEKDLRKIKGRKEVLKMLAGLLTWGEVHNG